MSVNSNKTGQPEKNQKPLMRLIDDDTNPCLKEAELSRKCLEDHFYVREECRLQYDNYNQCKKFWARVKAERKYKGIKPHLPKKEEREKILDLRQKGIHVNSVS